MKRSPRLLAAAAVIALVAVLARRRASAQDAPKSIPILAKRFEFVPNTLALKKGETVKLVLTTADVRHGFMQRDLKIDSEFAPGEATEILVTPRMSGTFTVICDHFCGAQHGNMKMTIVVP